MARSKRSNQRPDTLMQDRLPPDPASPTCNARPDHTLGQKQTSAWGARDVGLIPVSRHRRSDALTSAKCQTQTSHCPIRLGLSSIAAPLVAAAKKSSGPNFGCLIQREFPLLDHGLPQTASNTAPCAHPLVTEFSIELSLPVPTRNTKRIDDTPAVAERHAMSAHDTHEVNAYLAAAEIRELPTRT